MRFFVALFVLLLATRAAASPEKVTRYLDGAVVESEASTATGRIEFRVPCGMKAGTLRVKPLQDAVIRRVDVSAPLRDKKIEKEMAQLTGRRDALSDRLKALGIKEEIFRNAARTQSGKAPRATKSNREPLEAVRKGTDFALARLEEVFRERRKAESELRSIETRLSSLVAGGCDGSVARVWLTGKAGRVAVSYVMPGLTWSPSYDFRVNGAGEVNITMRALLSEPATGSKLAVVPANLSEGGGIRPVEVAPGWPGEVAVFRLPLDKEIFTPFPVSSLSVLFTNSTGSRLPPGEATCYRKGEYLGTTRFDGSMPGEARLLDCGRIAAAP